MMRPRGEVCQSDFKMGLKQAGKWLQSETNHTWLAQVSSFIRIKPCLFRSTLDTSTSIFLLACSLPGKGGCQTWTHQEESSMWEHFGKSFPCVRWWDGIAKSLSPDLSTCKSTLTSTTYIKTHLIDDCVCVHILVIGCDKGKGARPLKRPTTDLLVLLHLNSVNMLLLYHR